MRDWRGKRYWLIGASDGLGRALALQMSRAGAELILSSRSEDKLETLRAELPGVSSVVPLDVTDTAAITAAAEQIGPVDGLVYMAGHAHWVRPAEWDAAQADRMIAVNLTGAVRAVGAVMPWMLARGTGHIALTGSLAAYRGLPQMAVYGATKAGIMHLVESLNADLRGTDVDVQVINPGYIRTALTVGMSGTPPLALEAEPAARIFFEAMNDEVAKRAFPAALALAVRFAQFLPDWLYYRLVARGGRPSAVATITAGTDKTPH